MVLRQPGSQARLATTRVHGARDPSTLRPVPGGHVAESARLTSVSSVRAPVPGWVRGYQRTWLRGDVLAGVTVTAYLVPQVMAYAEVAGVPAAGRPLGGDRRADPRTRFSAPPASCRSGPESTTALMTAAALGSVAGPASDRVATRCRARAAGRPVFCVLGWVVPARRARRPAVAAGAGRLPRRDRRDHGRLPARQAARDPRGRRRLRRRAAPGARPPRRAARADGGPRA